MTLIAAAVTVPRTPEQLRENTVAPSNETLAKLDEIEPSPGGEAPMACTWQSASAGDMT